MTEEEGKLWIREKFGVSRETACASFVDLVLQEAKSQNLISAASVREIWARHIVDSAQLAHIVPTTEHTHWIDIGSGAGFPGFIVALVTDSKVRLIEPRRQRAQFLARAVQQLEVADRVVITAEKAERTTGVADVISARAVASLEDTFQIAGHLASPSTIWALPKGRNAREEVTLARKRWQGTFHVEHSLTNPDSLIVVATKVRRQ